MGHLGRLGSPKKEMFSNGLGGKSLLISQECVGMRLADSLSDFLGKP
jgi:hypothetical protein